MLFRTILILLESFSSNATTSVLLEEIFYVRRPTLYICFIYFISWFAIMTSLPAE